MKVLNFDGTIYEARTGSASQPSISFAGDSNTGIYSPGADQLAISTNGVGRLFVDASGNVGFNRTPTNSANYTTLDISGTNGSQILLNRTGSLDAFFYSSNGLAALGAGTGSALAIFTNSTGSSNERLRITSTGTVNIVGAGTAGSTQAISFNGSAPVNSLVVDSSGRCGIGTNSPGSTIHAKGGSISTPATASDFISNATARFVVNHGNEYGAYIGYANGTTDAIGIQSTTNIGSVKALLLNPYGGNVGIGTQSPGYLFEASRNSAGDVAAFTASTDRLRPLVFSSSDNTASGAVWTRKIDSAFGIHAWSINGTERARIRADGMFEVKGAGTAGASPAFSVSGSAPANSAQLDSSGRLLVGTSSSRTNYPANDFSGLNQIEGAGTLASFGLSITHGSSVGYPASLSLNNHKSNSVGGITATTNGFPTGLIKFKGSDGTNFIDGAQISGAADGDWSSGDCPGRLVFSTTADGASSPTERMRIDNAGIITNKTTNIGGIAGNGFSLSPNGWGMFTTSSEETFYVNRQTNDGVIISIRQDGTEEGTISVSGTTVSYNGAHLSRWSQLPSGAERTEILRGSVLSNIDEMCEWGDEENEQLNRMKVSNVEGDKNVSGVFQAWDDDDDTYTNDFYCAMTGDFIIRIGAGVTVERGDLLMSAGDGTAKPQNDDIIRSKTIAKVTSTNVSCTYDDGSYCVPCVLMAC